MTYQPPPDPFTTANTGAADAPLNNTPGWYYNLQLASWPRRTIATLIDFAIPAFIANIPDDVGYVIAIVFILINSVFLQARTYQSLGKLITGIALVWPAFYRPENRSIASRPSYLRCLVRISLHILDSLCLVGFVRPLWDRKRQTFADSIAHTLVTRKPPTPSETAPAGSVDAG